MKRIFIIILLLLSCTFASSYVELYTKESNNGNIEFYANNYALSPYQVLLKLTQLKNLSSSTNLPFYTVLPPQSKNNYLLTLSPVTNWKKKSFLQRYQTYPGDPFLFTNINYLFPFEHGSKYQVYQGYGGNRSHQGTFAIDFSTPQGTKLTAAMDGIVISYEDSFSRGGQSKYLRNKGNYIMIYHPANGTFTQYYHLQKKGVLVKIGQKVKAGESIGLSGNTGYTSGPHLHFTVLKPVLTNTLETFPSLFFQPGGQSIGITNGCYYNGYHPGNYEFLPVVGANLSNEMMDSYYLYVKTNWSLEVYPQDLDETTLLFARNGFPEWVKVSVNIGSDTNLKASRDLPYTAYIAPNREAYLLLFRPAVFCKKWSKKFTFKYSIIKRSVMENILKEKEDKQKALELVLTSGS